MVHGRRATADDSTTSTASGWRLVTVGPEPLDLDAELADWFTGEAGAVVRVTPDVDVDGTYAHWFAEHGCTWALQRPDFHVHGVGVRPRRSSGAARRPPPTLDRVAPSTPPNQGSDTMKIANVNGRATLVVGDEIVDIAAASDGAFSADPMSPYADWSAFVDFAERDHDRHRPARRGRPAAVPCRARARCSPSG